jgi:hypothetical protein
MKLIKIRERELIEKRTENLRVHGESAICPRGKWHGLDVFTWQNSLGLQLESTIAAFPFPVVLVFHDYENILRSKQALSSSDWVSSYVLIDDAIINGQDLEGVVVVPNLSSLSEMLYGFKTKGIVLFLFYDEIGIQKEGELNNYLKLVKSK